MFFFSVLQENISKAKTISIKASAARTVFDELFDIYTQKEVSTLAPKAKS